MPLTEQGEKIAVMANDIHHMKNSLERLEKAIEEGMKHNVSRTEFDQYKSDVAREFEEHKKNFITVGNDREDRIRKLEGNMTKVLTWGTVAMVAIGIIQFLIGKFL